MQYAGELYSLGAASIWAVAVILLRRSGETTTPLSLNLFRVGVSSLLLLLVLASIFLKEPFTARRWAAAGLAIGGILLVTFG